MFRELEIVAVRALLQDVRPIIGTDGVARQPRLGDIGTVVHVHGPNDFTVECVDADSGLSIWVADFQKEELAQAWLGLGSSNLPSWHTDGSGQEGEPW